MRYGILSGILWALSTVILGVALGLTPFVDAPGAILFAAVVGAFLHDLFCAVWLWVYMGLKGRIADTLRALRTKAGKVVILGALLGGPLGMTGYVVAIDHIGPGYTAIISAFYPAFGTFLAFMLLKEKMTFKQLICLFVALLGVMGMGYLSTAAGAGDAIGATSQTTTRDVVLGLLGAALCVVGWGSEAVLCAWGMRTETVDNEVALHIRETTSALVYAIAVLPLFGAWHFAATVAPSMPTFVVAGAALAGATSYLFYYKAIAKIGAARGMALNISYSVWAVVFGVVLLHVIPGPWELVCCAAVLVGTVLAASDWNELFGRLSAR